MNIERCTLGLKDLAIKLHYCLSGNTQTYEAKDKDGSITQSGDSNFVVVDQDFVLNIAESIDLVDLQK